MVNPANTSQTDHDVPWPRIMEIVREEVDKQDNCFDPDDMEGFIIEWLLQKRIHATKPYIIENGATVRHLTRWAVAEYIRNLYGRDGQKSGFVNSYSLNSNPDSNTTFDTTGTDTFNLSENTAVSRIYDPESTSVSMDMEITSLVNDVSEDFYIVDIVMIEMLLEGYLQPDIAETLNMSIQGVSRRIKVIRKQFAKNPTLHKEILKYPKLSEYF